MNKGFTLIELLVVSFLIVFITTTVLLNYRAGQSQLTLQRAAYKLAQDFRRAESLAGSSFSECNNNNYKYGLGIVFACDGTLNPADCPGPCSCTMDIGVSYRGVDRYSFFADCSGNGRCCNADKKMETDFIEKGVVIKNLRIVRQGSGSQDDVSWLYINFEPPDPKVTITANTGSPGTRAEITLALKSNLSKTMVITVNSTGMVDIR